MTQTPAGFEAFWHERLNDAMLQLEFARAYLKEVEQDLKLGCVSPLAGDLAHRNALQAEKFARQKVARVRKIFKDFVTSGDVHDDLESEAAGPRQISTGHER